MTPLCLQLRQVTCHCEPLAAVGAGERYASSCACVEVAACQCDRAATCAWSLKLALYLLRYCYYARMGFMCAANALI